MKRATLTRAEYLAKLWIERHYGKRYGGIARHYAWYQMTAAYEAGYAAAEKLVQTSRATHRG